MAIAGPSSATTSSGNPATAEDDKFYDKIYFDSDDEDDSQEMEGTGSDHRYLSNLPLLDIYGWFRLI